MFINTLLRVALMLAYAVPGFLLLKTKAVKADAISAFAKLLVYACAPALSLYSFSRATYTPELNGMMWICFATSFGLILLFFLLFRLGLIKLKEDVRWRVFNVSVALGNVGFFGIPLLEHCLPDHPEVLIFSEVMSLAMNMIAWTLGLSLVSGDAKYMKPLKIITVPSFLAMLVAYPMFLNGWSFPPQIESAIELLGRMSTPLCMVIMGMRLATVSIKELVTDWRSLLASLIKLTVFPLAMLGVMLMLPVEPFVRAAMFLVACCPSATVMLSLCEIINHGQKSAANTVLISTLLSVITIPLMILLFYPM